MAKSHELSVAIQLVLILLAIYLLASGFVVQLSNFATEIWSDDWVGQYGVDEFQDHLWRVAVCISGLLLPFLLAVPIVSIMSHLIQSGPMFQGDRIAPDVSRLSPLHWIKRVFSFASLLRGILGLPKVLIVVSVASAVFWMQRDAVLNLTGMDVGQMVPQLFSIVLTTAGGVAFALLATSLIDYVSERYSYQQRFRMTDQELRNEQRMQNVDPQIANRRRQTHQDLGRM